MDDTNTQSELERWREQAEHWHDESIRLQKIIDEARQQIASSPSSLIENAEFVTDCCRYSENLLSKVDVKKKWRFTDEAWKQLGKDDALIEAIEAEKLRRIRSGQAKREKAQSLVVKAPDVLDNIMMDAKANARHKVDAIKTLDALAGGNSPETKQQDRIIIRIDLGADIRAAGGTPDPKDVLVIETSPSPLLTDGNDD